MGCLLITNAQNGRCDRIEGWRPGTMYKRTCIWSKSKLYCHCNRAPGMLLNRGRWFVDEDCDISWDLGSSFYDTVKVNQHGMEKISNNKEIQGTALSQKGEGNTSWWQSCLGPLQVNFIKTSWMWEKHKQITTIIVMQLNERNKTEDGPV